MIRKFVFKASLISKWRRNWGIIIEIFTKWQTAFIISMYKYNTNQKLAFYIPARLFVSVTVSTAHSLWWQIGQCGQLSDSGIWPHLHALCCVPGTACRVTTWLQHSQAKQHQNWPKAWALDREEHNHRSHPHITYTVPTNTKPNRRSRVVKRWLRLWDCNITEQESIPSLFLCKC